MSNEKKSFLSLGYQGVELYNNIVSVLDSVGMKARAGTLIASVLVGVSAWFWSNVPWYVSLVLIGTVLFLSLGIVHKVQLIRATSSFNPASYKDFGERTIRLAEDIRRFLVDRERGAPPEHYEAGRSIEELHRFLAIERGYTAETERLFSERYEADYLSTTALFVKLGIEMPAHFFSGLSSFKRMPPFFNLIGGLLEKGAVQEAVEISKNENFIWNLR